NAVRKGQIKILPPSPEKQAFMATGPGCRVPDIVVTDLASKKPVRLYELLGRPILIIFYNPQSSTGANTLQFAKRVHDKYPAKVNILGLAMTNKLSAALKQHKDLELPFPVAD